MNLMVKRSCYRKNKYSIIGKNISEGLTDLAVMK